MRVPLSVVVIAKNEEARIEGCLKSVYGWAEEIILVDDESIDRTRDLASRYTDKILLRRMDIEGRHRNWAYSQADCKWVLSLDADERATDSLKEEIGLSIVSNNFSHYSMPYINYIGDYPLKGDINKGIVKLFEKDKFKYEEVEVHPRIITSGSCGRLKSPMLHYCYRDFEDFLSKLNRQTTLEASKWICVSKSMPQKARHKMNLPHALWRTVDRFVRTFCGRKAYRDGFVGFMFSVFGGLYQLVSYAKYTQMKSQDDKNAQN
ncbi:MAG: glycosyltransferase family 2 protein [Candidatus Omnitrophota bacterium]